MNDSHDAPWLVGPSYFWVLREGGEGSKPFCHCVPGNFTNALNVSIRQGLTDLRHRSTDEEVAVPHTGLSGVGHPSLSSSCWVPQVGIPIDCGFFGWIVAVGHPCQHDSSFPDLTLNYWKVGTVLAVRLGDLLRLCNL